MMTLTGVHECFSRWGVFSAILIPSDYSSLDVSNLKLTFLVYIFFQKLRCEFGGIIYSFRYDLFYMYFEEENKNELSKNINIKYSKWIL